MLWGSFCLYFLIGLFDGSTTFLVKTKVELEISVCSWIKRDIPSLPFMKFNV